MRALVRRPERASHLRALGVELAAGDITDPASLQAAVAGCTHVIHLVAIIQGSAADFQRVMTQGTSDLVAAAKEAGVERFVLMSALGTSESSAERGAVLRGQVGGGAGRRRLGPRARDLPPELRLRPRRRRAADVHEAGALLTRRHRDRRRAAALAADLGRRRRRVLRARDRRPGGRESHVRARRPRHGRLERPLPDDRQGARQAPAPGARADRRCPARARS